MDTNICCIEGCDRPPRFDTHDLHRELGSPLRVPETHNFRMCAECFDEQVRMLKIVMRNYEESQ